MASGPSCRRGNASSGIGFRYLLAPSISSSAALGSSGSVQKITTCENIFRFVFCCRIVFGWTRFASGKFASQNWHLRPEFGQLCPGLGRRQVASKFYFRTPNLCFAKKLCLFPGHRTCSTEPYRGCSRTITVPALGGFVAHDLAIQPGGPASGCWRSSSVCHGAEAPGQTDLTELPLESLLQMEVSLVSRKPENSPVPLAAIAVVTQERIIRGVAGSTSIEEALRLVPGLQVARVDASQWAITARGFNDVFANKLLLLQDGRTLYTPLFSGVFWDVQGTMMEDIERIEVVRGPGAALWGANAVNGVINIITKSARETQGLLLAAGGGTEERAFASVRYGAKISENAYFRVYGTYQNHDTSVLADGARADDSWQLGRWGFRVDWDLSEQNHLTLQGEAYRERSTRFTACSTLPTRSLFRAWCRMNMKSSAATCWGDGRMPLERILSCECRPIMIGPSAILSFSPKNATPSTSTFSIKSRSAPGRTWFGARGIGLPETTPATAHDFAQPFEPDAQFI